MKEEEILKTIGRAEMVALGKDVKKNKDVQNGVWILWGGYLTKGWSARVK